MSKKRDHRGPKSPRWKGGRVTTVGGYVLIYAPDHPHAYRNQVYEHKLIAEAALGHLLPTETRTR